jgi:hypothetical protein
MFKLFTVASSAVCGAFFFTAAAAPAPLETWAAAGILGAVIAGVAGYVLAEA